MLGISLYPEKTSFKEMQEYLVLAKKYNFNRLFLSLLQLGQENRQESIDKYKQIIREANRLGYEVTIDFIPQLFEIFESTYQDLKFLFNLGIKTIRLDAGMTGKEEAQMTRNPYGIHIELNASHDSHYLNQILDYGANKKQLCGCHNFFPQKYTGLSSEQFYTYTTKFRNENLKTAAFITSPSGKYGPWPLHEGLCTLEHHRNIPIDLQVLDLIEGDLIDDIIIGNMFATKEEMKKVSEAYNTITKKIQVSLLTRVIDFEKSILFDYTHNYRGDSSDYMIRSTRIRAKIVNERLPKQGDIIEIKRGDILILNEEYGQYKGEVQIALKDRPGDQRINIVGKIPDNRMFLLDHLHKFEDFIIEELENE